MARKLRVLHIGKFYPPHRGGMESHLAALCEQLRDRVELEVLVAAEDGRTVEETIAGVAVTRMAAPLTLASTSLCPSLPGRIRRSQADVIHIHLPNPAAVLAWLATPTQARLVATYHSDVIRQRILNLFFTPLLHGFLRRADAILATSPNYIEHSTVLGRHRGRCHVVPLGIPLAAYLRADEAAVERIRRQHGERLILAAGRHIYYKGFEYLIDAMLKVKGRLLLAGDGPLQEALRQQAAHLGIADRVIFLGNISDEELIACYHAVDVFALPSIARTEAFGIVQIEAMAAGTPVVNTRLDSGVPFVSLDEVTGLTVPPGDVQALAAALNRLLDDEPLRRKLGAAARERARTLFSAEAMADRTLEIYNAVSQRGEG